MVIATMERPKAECSSEAEKPFDPDWFIKLVALELAALEATSNPVGDLSSDLVHPVWNRINRRDLWRLLYDYHNGLLAEHDDSLGISRIRASGHGSTLTNNVTHDQADQAWLLLTLMKPQPVGWHEPIQGWWAFCIDVAQDRIKISEVDTTVKPAPGQKPVKRRLDNEYAHLPEPTFEDSFRALTVYAIQLWKEVFGGSIKDLLDAAPAKAA